MRTLRPAARVTIATLSLLVLGLMLTACDPLSVGLPDDSATASPSATPSASASASPLVSIPIDCRNIVDQATYTAAFGNTPLNDPAFAPTGQIPATTPPAGATLYEQLRAARQLACVWRDPGADTTGLFADFARVDPAVAGSYLDSLPADGYTCEAKYGGQWCQRIQKNEQYPVDDGYTSFVRDDIYIEIYQSNFPTSGLLQNIVATLWGA